ncbi:aspartate aminotransferase family protein [Thiomicrorhabdus sediminis]|uniref:Acetylornithine aminotransferase n=1 Tax=Thiomicrorhabdus sediminis TaxID=2580412 RepID=A0A4P9K743_9GAMM|nr:aspartate aminotransferase family protein [Thiomicrorhabdus sediminis]QCU90711.1 aspartate aminotransferase family protein [Thiomicrorhabdus sediminis]
MSDHLMNTYARLPVSFEKGNGATLIDSDGKTYLDAISGIAVCSLGHAHPAVSDAICEQSHKLIHTSNLYQIGNQQKLADKLIELSGMDRVFFCNSGAEANETALKIARKHANDNGIENPAVIVMNNSFHGRTYATLSATGNDKVHAGFTPLMEGFIRVPFDDVDAVKAHSANQNIVAILVEPVQGEGGVHVPKPGYLKALREICDTNGWLLMLDEIQTGIGRTGAWFAFQHEDIKPDVVTLAKALGNGMPIGACMATSQAAQTLVPGNHGTTFGGNPLACAAGLAVLNTMQVHNHIKSVVRKGADLLAAFTAELSGQTGIVDIRGKGYMIGIQLNKPCGELVTRALEKGLLINVTRGDTVRLLPTFVMSDEQSKHLVSTLSQLIKEFLNE